MDFNTKELQRAIGKLKGLIPSKTPYPVIKGILYSNGAMTATDLNVHAKVSVSTGLIPTDETFIIPVIAFDAINKLASDITTIEGLKANNTFMVRVSSGKFNTTFVSSDPAEFPTLDANNDDLVSAEVNFVEFSKCLDGVSYAVSVDEKKGNLCGVNVASMGTGICFTALDGFRASRTRLNFDDMRSFNTTVPEGFWKVLGKIGANENKATFSVAESGKNVSIKGAEFEVQSRTLDGSFPDVDKIMNGLNPDKQVIVDKDEIIHALDLHSAALKDSGANNLIVCDADPTNSALIFSARSEASSFRFEIAAECNGFSDVFRIGFNSKYLADAIKALPDTTNVMLSLKAPIAGALVQNADSPEMGAALVLPVRING